MWGPAKLGFDFGKVDSVTNIMAGTVFDVFDGGVKVFLQDLANDLDGFQVSVFFFQTTYTIGLAELASVQDKIDSTAVIGDIEPVTDLIASAINRDFLAFEKVGDGEREKFFGKHVWTIIVGAVGDRDGELVGLIVGADKVVGGGFAGGVGRIGAERGIFLKLVG